MSNIDEKISLTILSKAYKHFSLNPLTNIGCSIGLMNKTDVYNWKCTLSGPNDTPYKGGLFQLFINFPKNFPIGGPTVIFDTPIYHMNVSKNVEDANRIAPAVLTCIPGIIPVIVPIDIPIKQAMINSIIPINYFNFNLYFVEAINLYLLYFIKLKLFGMIVLIYKNCRGFVKLFSFKKYLCAYW